jgi:predicted nucleic acid-binding protein
MPVPTLYLDTSVIGGYFDAEWMKPTRELWRLMELGMFRFTTSIVTAQELIRAPKQVRMLFTTSFTKETILPVPDEAKQLAAAYIRQGVLPEKYTDDAQHVAACTVAGIEYLVSWNFKHLVNVERKKGFNGINLLHGHRNVSIISPHELIYDDRERTA